MEGSVDTVQVTAAARSLETFIVISVISLVSPAQRAWR
jgi:hypothetical protein